MSDGGTVATGNDATACARASELRSIRSGFTTKRRLRSFAVLLFADPERADSSVPIDVELELHTNPALIPLTARVARNRNVIGAIAHMQSPGPVAGWNAAIDRVRRNVNDHFRSAFGCVETQHPRSIHAPTAGVSAEQGRRLGACAA